MFYLHLMETTRSRAIGDRLVVKACTFAKERGQRRLATGLLSQMLFGLLMLALTRHGLLLPQR